MMELLKKTRNVLQWLECLSIFDVKQTVQNDDGQVQDNHHFAANSSPHTGQVHASNTCFHDDFYGTPFYPTKFPPHFLISLQGTVPMWLR